MSNRNRNEPANHNNNIGFRCGGIRALSFGEVGQSRLDSGLLLSWCSFRQNRSDQPALSRVEHGDDTSM